MAVQGVGREVHAVTVHVAAGVKNIFHSLQHSRPVSAPNVKTIKFSEKSLAQ